MPAKKPMTQAQIFDAIAEQHEALSKKQVKEVLNSMAELAYKEAKAGFTVPGIGKLVVVKRKARMGRNPATGESIKIPARTALKFRVSKTAKDNILTAKAAPKKATKKKTATKKTAAKKTAAKKTTKKKTTKKR